MNMHNGRSVICPDCKKVIEFPELETQERPFEGECECKYHTFPCILNIDELFGIYGQEISSSETIKEGKDA